MQARLFETPSGTRIEDMLNQIIRLAHSQDFKRFSILLSNGVRYNVRTRDHISVPPIDEEEKPDFFFVWTDHAYRIVSLANVEAIEVEARPT